ncbi:hypothetical protein ACFPIJ_43855 [Dactylosporangium cerinum]|uniref:Uncharacterized protein n=1 Tax=Dactylosporangium cerinum TaxID=1434730 RepID=A0ABV9WB81_9ACTN
MYSRRQLIDAYLGARGYDDRHDESSAFNAALREHHSAVLHGLERLFGLRLDRHRTETFDHRVLLMLFSSTAASVLALRTPWSNFLEAGLLIMKVEQAGPPGARVMAESARINTLTAESRQAHLAILDDLAAIMLGDRAELTFTPAELQAMGVDDTPPSPADHLSEDD